MWRKGWCGEDGVKVTLCNACGACVRMSLLRFFLTSARSRSED